MKLEKKHYLEDSGNSLKALNPDIVNISSNYEKSLNLFDYKPVRTLRYKVRHKLSKLNLVSDRVKKCGHSHTSTVILQKDTENRSKLSGVHYCGNVWSCPVCSSKILQRRQEELEVINSEHIKQTGGSVLLVTLTVRHNISDSLKDLLGDSESKVGISGAFRRLRQDRAFRELKEEFGIHLSCRSLETTWGQLNGYHVHIHSLFYLDRKLSDIELVDLESRLYDCWSRCCIGAGLENPSKERGVDISDGTNAGKYISKWGSVNELTSPVGKGAKNGNFTIWELQRFLINPELLDSYDGMTLDLIISVLKDYFKCFFGKKLLTWSDPNKLRKKYLEDGKLLDKTDEEIVSSSNIEAVHTVSIHKEVYDRILSLNRVSEMFSVHELKGFDGLYDYIKSLGFTLPKIDYVSNKLLSEEDLFREADSLRLKYGFFPDYCEDINFLRYCVLNYHKLLDITKISPKKLTYELFGEYLFYIKDFYNQCFQ